jgi:hypothetical protein
MDGDLIAPQHLTPDFPARKGRPGTRPISADPPAAAAPDTDAFPDQPDAARRNRMAVRLTIVAVIWSLGLVIGVLVLPVYNTTALSADGTTFITETVVAGQGAWVLIPVAVPLAVTGVVALALRRMRAGADGHSGPLPWAAIVALAALGLVLILSIGGLMIPVALALARAVTLTSPAR